MPLRCPEPSGAPLARDEHSFPCSYLRGRDLRSLLRECPHGLPVADALSHGTLAYTTRKFLRDNGEGVPGDLRMRAEETVAEVERCLEDTDVDALRTSTERLAQVSRRMRTAA